MPYLDIHGYQFYYETAGDPAAEPLLIISGLTDYTPKVKWQTTDLAADFFVITFDNRGGGRTSTPTPGYTMTDMADDAAGILDALHLDSAHVFGFSMGGMSALNLVIRHPNKVRRLILGCTTAGGRLNIPPDSQVVASLSNPVTTGDARQDFLNGVRFSVSKDFIAGRPDVIDALALLSAENPQTPLGYAGQLKAILSHDVIDRLEEIDVPTIILHGEADRIIPAQNGRQLAERIKGARLILYPGAGHLFFIERAAEVNQHIRDFLRGAN